MENQIRYILLSGIKVIDIGDNNILTAWKDIECRIDFYCKWSRLSESAMQLKANCTTDRNSDCDEENPIIFSSATLLMFEH